MNYKGDLIVYSQKEKRKHFVGLSISVEVLL